MGNKDREVELSNYTVNELREIAKQGGLRGYSKLRKDALIHKIISENAFGADKPNGSLVNKIIKNRYFVFATGLASIVSLLLVFFPFDSKEDYAHTKSQIERPKPKVSQNAPNLPVLLVSPYLGQGKVGKIGEAILMNINAVYEDYDIKSIISKFSGKDTITDVNSAKNIAQGENASFSLWGIVLTSDRKETVIDSRFESYLEIKKGSLLDSFARIVNTGPEIFRKSNWEIVQDVSQKNECAALFVTAILLIDQAITCRASEPERAGLAKAKSLLKIVINDCQTGFDSTTVALNYLAIGMCDYFENQPVSAKSSVENLDK